ncbi:MAG TPA: AraC family transcriptional regulator [Microlunatus sp.]|nr:AraC family transcriptional regulator [Microlunatus sp.]
MASEDRIRAWRPGIPGVAEVFHARFADHAYPQHVHEAWTLLIVDRGTIGYRLEGRDHGSTVDRVTLLPPGIPHDGHPATRAGFVKRVLYLEADQLTGIGATVDRPTMIDPALRDRLHRLHQALAAAEGLEAESRLALIRERVQAHLNRAVDAPHPHRDRPLAARLRDLLDARIVDGVTLAEAAERLHATPEHLVRSFAREYGLPPHQYLTGRRVDRARRLLLAGRGPAEVAAEVGFHDQSHLTRHFRRVLGVTPGRYARTSR